MPVRHVTVDGSNIATEGRKRPSFRQLEEALREFRKEYPDAQLAVVVDASFAHRIDPAERARFERAESSGEVVSPPAGAIGRGDAFLLRIAERTGAAVLSNDSFQEFHGEHGWLFSDGRLIGGKPVPGVGWIFTPRTPVRGVRSRAASSKVDAAPAKASTAKAPAKQTAKQTAKQPAKQTARQPARQAGPKQAARHIQTAPPASVAGRARTQLPTKESGKVARDGRSSKAATKARQTPKRSVAASKRAAGKAPGKAPGSAARPQPKRVQEAIVTATAEAMSSPDDRKRRRHRSAGPPPDSVNDPLTFITFVAEHPPGSKVEGAVESFTSHGAFVAVDGTRCYIPLSALGSPPPRRAREVLSRGQRREFVVQALDAPRRGVELALPALAGVRGAPTEDTISADMAGAARKAAARVPEKRGAAKGAPRQEPAKAGKAASSKSATPPKTATTAKTAKTAARATAKKSAVKSRAAKSAVAKSPGAARDKAQGAKKPSSTRRAPSAGAQEKASRARKSAGAPAKRETVAGRESGRASKASARKTPASKASARKASARARGREPGTARKGKAIAAGSGAAASGVSRTRSKTASRARPTRRRTAR